MVGIVMAAVAMALIAGPAAATGGPVLVPEPTSLALLGMAAAGVVAAYRIRRRK